MSKRCLADKPPSSFIKKWWPEFTAGHDAHIPQAQQPLSGVAESAWRKRLAVYRAGVPYFFP